MVVYVRYSCRKLSDSVFIGLKWKLTALKSNIATLIQSLDFKLSKIVSDDSEEFGDFQSLESKFQLNLTSPRASQRHESLIIQLRQSFFKVCRLHGVPSQKILYLKFVNL